jgi:hypothetical protein
MKYTIMRDRKSAKGGICLGPPGGHIMNSYDMNILDNNIIKLGFG